MAKKAITFLAGWSRYNAGETAAFDEDQADALIKGRKAILAKKQPPEAGDQVTLALKVDVRETDDYKDAMAEIMEQAEGLAKLSAELDERAAALDDREAKLAAAAEKAAAGAAPVADDKPAAKSPADAADKPAGLPKQGR